MAVLNKIIWSLKPLCNCFFVFLHHHEWKEEDWLLQAWEQTLLLCLEIFRMGAKKKNFLPLKWMRIRGLNLLVNCWPTEKTKTFCWYLSNLFHKIALSISLLTWQVFNGVGRTLKYLVDHPPSARSSKAFLDAASTLLPREVIVLCDFKAEFPR